VPIRVVAFDWGNTLIRTRGAAAAPERPGAELMPGVVEALESIRDLYTCCVATNAGRSDASRVGVALERFGIRTYFAHVFTALDLGVSKPNPLFFEAMLQTLGALPHEAVMVGDDYLTDVTGAKRVGMNTIWVAHTPVQGRPPEADAVVASLHELPGALSALAPHPAPERLDA
jgi:putative hydrolase of the HAD superfamily